MRLKAAWSFEFDSLENKNLNHRFYAFKQKLVCGVAFYADAVKAKQVCDGLDLLTTAREFLDN